MSGCNIYDFIKSSANEICKIIHLESTNESQ